MINYDFGGMILFYLLSVCNLITDGTGKDLYSPEAESSPAPSFVEPTVVAQIVGTATKPTSRTSSFEIENLLKTAEQVSSFRHDHTTNTWLQCPKIRGQGVGTGKCITNVATTTFHNNHHHHNLGYHYHTSGIIIPTITSSNCAAVAAKK